MMIRLEIKGEDCIRCGRCVKVCPSMILQQPERGGAIEVVHPENCIVCGHCAAICPAGAVVHSEFPPFRIHSFRPEDYPTPEQVMLLCKGRRSNRAFSEEAVPGKMLEQIVEAAHRAPTASNSRNISFTVVTDPAHLKLVTEFTLSVFGKALKKLKNPLLKPLVRRLVPDALRYIPVFERLQREYATGNDLVLRKAKAVLFIHAPRKSRFGFQDANLAYQNASLMAESLGVSQFYTGFVCSAMEQEKKGSLEKALGIDGRIFAGMALGMPLYGFHKYMDREEADVRWI